MQKKIEVTIPIKDLIDYQDSANNKEHCEFHLDNENFFIRKPTGRDQIQWQNMSFLDENSALKDIVKRLLISKDKNNSDILGRVLKKENIDIINKKMKDFDPLIDFEIEITCPYCNEENSYIIDLEGHSLDKMHQSQQKLLGNIHHIASKYHWSENQILSLPLWRREEYISLIKKEDEKH